MNQELAIILRDRLINFPFCDILAGMARTVSTRETNMDDNVSRIDKRFPVCSDTLGVNCEGREILLTPDSSRKSIIYFEDFGVAVTGREHGLVKYNSSIRLVCWMNRANLVGDQYKLVAGRAMAMIIDRLTGKNPINSGIFTRLVVEVVRIPPAEAGLFGRYTYSEPETQYLRPPFEFFAIDFSCKYHVPSACLTTIDWNSQICF